MLIFKSVNTLKVMNPKYKEASHLVVANVNDVDVPDQKPYCESSSKLYGQMNLSICLSNSFSSISEN